MNLPAVIQVRPCTQSFTRTLLVPLDLWITPSYCRIIVMAQRYYNLDY